MGLFSRTLSRLDELKKVLTKDPGSRQFLALADEYRRQGQIQEAIETLEHGLAQSPGSVAGHVALGRLRHQAGRVEDAVASFQSALKLDPQNLVALRQLGELYLASGEKVEAIKKLKLFRGLSPGDREVNDLIRQLDVDLAAASSQRILVRQDEPAASAATAVPEPAPVAPAPGPPPAAEAPSPAPALEVLEASPFGEIAPMEAGAAAGVAILEPFQARQEAASTEVPPATSVFEQTSPVEEAPPSPAEVARVEEEAAPEPPYESTPVPIITETLAELLRSQGHLGDARVAYEELARSESDADHARRLLAVADEISADRARTLRGRLETWAEPFSRNLPPRNADLVSAVEEVAERLGRAAVVVTDFEGVPVVSAGPRAEAEAMEVLAAELTAFWKNARRSREEIGEGALDSLVLSGSAGTAAVKLITTSYALLLKAGPGIPAGRIRFEAVRAAEQLRPALL